MEKLRLLKRQKKHRRKSLLQARNQVEVLQSPKKLWRRRHSAKKNRRSWTGCKRKKKIGSAQLRRLKSPKRSGSRTRKMRRKNKKETRLRSLNNRACT